MGRGIFVGLFVFIFHVLSGQIIYEEDVVYFRNGEAALEANGLAYLRTPPDKFSSFDGRVYSLVQFDQIPNKDDKADMEEMGMNFLFYLPKNTYYISFPIDLNYDRLSGFGIVATDRIDKRIKISSNLLDIKNVNSISEIKVKCGVTNDVSIEKIRLKLSDFNVETIETEMFEFGSIDVLIASDKIDQLADLPFLLYLDTDISEPIPLRYYTTPAQRVNLLHHTSGGGLDGTGVVVGIGDNGIPGQHIDFDHIIMAPYLNASIQLHPALVTGVLAGSDNLNPERGVGCAPNVRIIYDIFSAILNNAPAYYQDYGMRITNNSYGQLGSCSQYGEYNQNSATVDAQLNSMQDLLHVFSAGNSGREECSPYPTGYGTVFGGWQSAKNVLTVGVTSLYGDYARISSVGPVDDGRLKPELVAISPFLYSTTEDNLHQSVGISTSLAAPMMSGIAALMYQRYKQLNGGNPTSSLVQGLLCNGADDLGNPGPDYQFGFGKVNADNAAEMLNKGFYMEDIVSEGQSDLHTISVPANTAELKVMLIWNDPDGSPLSSVALVNDLNLQVTDPSSVTFNPWILDPSPSGVTLDATRGIDNLNNKEQVTISNPASGNYTISVAGFQVPTGAQDYSLVYNILPKGIQLTYPNEDEKLLSGDIIVHWDAAGTSGSYTAEYTLDNGVSWTTISDAINATNVRWTVPNTASNQVKIRITDNADPSILDESDGVSTILGLPTDLTLTGSGICEGNVDLSWTGHDDAAAYAIYQLIDGDMVQIGTTTETNFSACDLTLDELAYFSIASIDDDGFQSLRVIAESIEPSLLPIELHSFSVELEGLLAKLKWTTASEVDNDYFDIERSLDGINFEAIGSVDGAGLSNSLVHYSFIDDLNNTSIGRGDYLYYRLKQVDYDGKFTYSPIRIISLSDVVKQEFRVFPNPAFDYLSISGELNDDDYNVNIYDLHGTTIYSQQYENNSKINTSSLVAGTYIVELVQSSTKSRKYINRFIKLD